MAPITKKGDRIIACQPDWETFVLFNGELDDSRPIASLFQ